MQKYAKAVHARVSFISGDVHCAAVGMLKTFVKEKKKGDVPPGLDYRYMLNIVSSMFLPHLTADILSDSTLNRCDRKYPVSSGNSRDHRHEWSP